MTTPSPIGPGTSNRELAETLDPIWAKLMKGQSLDERELDAIREAAERIGENPDDPEDLDAGVE